MSRFDKLALALSLIAVLLSAWVALGVYDGLAQLEDEYAYLWQARLISMGEIKIPSPPQADQFIVPFIVDYQGERFGKYPLAWPALLSLGERLGLRWLVNPLLGGLAVWLIYRLGKKLLDEKAGLLAAGLTAFSPLFLTYAGSLLSHTWGLVLALGFCLAWLDLGGESDSLPGWLPSLSAGATLGVLALSRPWTALGVALPFGVQGILQVWRGSPVLRKRIPLTALIALLLASLHFLWQFALTGDALLNPYTLWWSYDRVGFGPGHGTLPGGHTLAQALLNTRYSLSLTAQDLLGWGPLTWLLPLAGVWVCRRRKNIGLIGSVFFSLAGVYLAYWVSGPRYFYEGLFSLTILSAAGIAWLAGWLRSADAPADGSSPSKLRERLTLGGLALLMILSALFYTPQRLTQIQARYGFSQDTLAFFETTDTQALAPALILVHARDWKDYGVYLHLEDPALTSPLIFAWVLSGEDSAERLAASFPDRTLYHFYPDDPGQLYPAPQP